MSAKVSTFKQRPAEDRRVAELFAGVGGFRLGLEGLTDPAWCDWEGKGGAGWNVVWSNQWEPGTKTQHASDCYTKRFGAHGHVCGDIAVALDEAEAGQRSIPDFDLLVGGFPCQDYSVAKVLSQAAGMHGKKGVLWWEIFRLLQMKQPSHIILENVDRLLKSPASQRGRDFAVILWCLQSLGYLVEWRVVNAADYGFPQRRRRVFIVAHRVEAAPFSEPADWLFTDGVLAEALPIVRNDLSLMGFSLSSYVGGARKFDNQLVALSDSFGLGEKLSRFSTGGICWNGQVWTAKVEPVYEPQTPIKSILISDGQVPAEFFISDEELGRWTHLKGSKKEERFGRDGFSYFYNEGPVAFPEPLNRPSRTILTGEGGRSASRFKHVIKKPNGRYRRLTPVELERLNGFPDDWTDTGMPDTKRAFMMGNALVVGVVRRIGVALDAYASRKPQGVSVTSKSAG